MLIAEIRNKLPELDDFDLDSHDAKERIQAHLAAHKEDILTADVFGVLKYLPREPYLRAVFQRIAAINHESTFQETIDKLSWGDAEFKFEFWPSYETPIGLDGNRTEPDVEITCPGLRLLVEAKYRSGFGANQIERQLLLREVNDPRPFFWLAVTDRMRQPLVSLGGKSLSVSEYLQTVASQSTELSVEQRDMLQNAKRHVLWISWHDLALAILESHEKIPDNARCRSFSDMLDDLRQLLKMREIEAFKGIHPRRFRLISSRPLIFKSTEPGSGLRTFNFHPVARPHSQGPRYRFLQIAGEQKNIWNFSRIATRPKAFTRWRFLGSPGPDNSTIFRFREIAQRLRAVRITPFFQPEKL